MSQIKVKQIRAAQLLASGMDSKEVANAVKVTPETISHWKKSPAFQAYFNELRWEVMESSRERLRSLFSKAIGTIEELMAESKSDSVRLRAAQSVLNVYGPSTQEGRTWYWQIGARDAGEIEAKEAKKKIWASASQYYSI